MQKENSIPSIEAWKIIQSSSAVLVDVRTDMEWETVGVPKIEGKLYKIPLNIGEEMQINPDFASIIKATFRNKDETLIFICKTNGRSCFASELAKNLGYKNSFFVADGFEGTSDSDGWKNLNLPYELAKKL